MLYLGLKLRGPPGPAGQLPPESLPLLHGDLTTHLQHKLPRQVTGTNFRDARPAGLHGGRNVLRARPFQVCRRQYFILQLCLLSSGEMCPPATPGAVAHLLDIGARFARVARGGGAACPPCPHTRSPPCARPRGSRPHTAGQGGSGAETGGRAGTGAGQHPGSCTWSVFSCCEPGVLLSCGQ